MKRPRRRNGPLLLGLYLNAALLLALIVMFMGRGGFSSNVYAAPQTPPIAGGGGVFLMPAQFAMNVWGCYLMDIDTQTLCAYTYDPAAHRLQLVASRYYRYDRMLKHYNTWPNPDEIQHMIDVEHNNVRGREVAPPGDAPATQSTGEGPTAPGDLR